jgi:putative transposase
MYGKHSISIDNGGWYPSTDLQILQDKALSSFLLRKSIIERTIQYIKDRIEGFDDYFPCRKYNCKLKHIIHLMNFLLICIIRDGC